MHSPASIAKPVEWPYISTGHLTQPESVQKLVSDAHARFKSNTEGQISQVHPALARVPSEAGSDRLVHKRGEQHDRL